MNFLAYASAIAVYLVQLVDVNYVVKENGPWCKQVNIFGYVSGDSRFFSVCTDRIILFSRSVGVDPAYYIDETIYHEVAHIAQLCRPPKYLLGIPPQNMSLNAQRARDVLESTRLTSPSNKQREHEAFWLEDKPKEVMYYYRRFCM